MRPRVYICPPPQRHDLEALARGHGLHAAKPSFGDGSVAFFENGKAIGGCVLIFLPSRPM